MQKLLVEFKNAPEAPPQVPCSVSEALNRKETLSVLVLVNNNSAQEIHSGKSGQDLQVPVINMQKQSMIDGMKNSEQVEIPTGLYLIKIIIVKEVKRAIPPPIVRGGLIAQLL